MIITRSPLRITLGGGGTDLPSYYRDHGGFLIAAAIDKYVYITLHDTFEPIYSIKYSKLERVLSVDEIEHPIIREALKLVNAGQREAQRRKRRLPRPSLDVPQRHAHRGAGQVGDAHALEDRGLEVGRRFRPHRLRRREAHRLAHGTQHTEKRGR